ncbi:MAG: TetR/AcrR family transcriptional regulator [Tannerella sp.]|jgi:AcrR family transcriptional regulator|nr:TetR/AcrR family transcriptional regulator [Tannerella sp.]
MLKEQIVEAAKRLFSQNGVKRVSMNDVAGEAGVSKRTLYELFENKEALLVEILRSVHLYMLASLGQLEIESRTALDIILLFNQKMLQNPTYYCNAFYDDLHRYPEAVVALQEEKKLLMDRILSLLKRGVDEGIFLPEINYDMIILMAKEYMKMSPPPKVFKRYAHEEVRNTFFLILIRGICTDAGRKVLKYYMIKGYYDNLRQQPPAHLFQREE